MFLILYKGHMNVEFIIFLGCFLFLLSSCLIIFFYQHQIRKINNRHNQALSILRHDIKGILSPALLHADRIILNKSADQKIIQSAEAIATSIEKASNYLKSTQSKK